MAQTRTSSDGSLGEGVYEVEAIVGRRVVSVRASFSPPLCACSRSTAPRPLRPPLLPAAHSNLTVALQGRTEYLIKWLNWSDDQNTWEKERCAAARSRPSGTHNSSAI